MFQVFAFRKSAVSTGEVKFELRKVGTGFCFVNTDTAKPETGSLTEDANKFEALDLFRKVSGDMAVRFELV